MLRVSKLADYGTVVMVYLVHHQQKLCNARDIALQTHLSVPTVSKLLKKLTAAGLLISVRGASGGYRLQRHPSEISVVDILFALDEHRGIIECDTHSNDCSISHVCRIQTSWRLISRAIESALASVTLESLAKPVFPIEHLERVKQLAMGVERG